MSSPKTEIISSYYGTLKKLKILIVVDINNIKFKELIKLIS